MKAYIDPYIDKKTGNLKNILGITDAEQLREAEANLTGLAIREISVSPVEGRFDFTHLCRIHRAIFKDIYEWAGSQRIINIEKAEEALGGLSVEYAKYDEIQREAGIVLTKMNGIQWEKLSLDQKAMEFSDCMASLWKVHPFREGNTRTTVTFFCDFAESKGFGLKRELLKDNSVYLRRALVAASAKFTDLGDLSRPEFLRKIVRDSMEQGEAARQQNGEKESMSDWKKEIEKEKGKDGHMKSDIEKVHAGNIKQQVERG